MHIINARKRSIMLLYVYVKAAVIYDVILFYRGAILIRLCICAECAKLKLKIWCVVFLTTNFTYMYSEYIKLIYIMLTITYKNFFWKKITNLMNEKNPFDFIYDLIT